MTLIEVMIALVITTVGLLGALAMVGSLYTASAFNRNATEAMSLAQSKIEQAQSMTVTLADGNALDTIEYNLDAYGNNTTPLTALNMFTRTTKWTSSPDGSRRVCTVDVGWNDLSKVNADGTPFQHSVTMSTERIP